MRKASALLARWKWLIVGCFGVYCLVVYWPLNKLATNENSRRKSISPKIIRPTKESEKNTYALDRKDIAHKEQLTGFEFIPAGGPPLFVEELLTGSDISLKERLEGHADKTAPPQIILSWNAGHSQDNLGGCPDWNCKLTHDRKQLRRAGAVLLARNDPSFKRRSDQYVIYFSQESPVNSVYEVPYPDFFNMTLGFRHDTPSSSPYGYTVKLAPISRPKKEVINMTRVNGKTKGAAWFVSHCSTNSRRETYIDILERDFPVDTYGRCGQLKCAHGGACEDMLDQDYHFYIAFENSVCKHYITEKLWNQGYQRDIVPIVLKRSLVEPFVPPNSFIAADDFKSVKSLAAHLHYLMKNKTAYVEYFSWRREYKVVFLNGHLHDAMERPWGFCQICRLLWENPRPSFSINNFQSWWKQSCEADGELVDRLIGDHH